MGRDAQFYARAGAVALTILVIALYSYSRAEDIIRGPRIEVTAPLSGATLTDPLVEVTGTARNIVRISFNGRDIFVDEAGVFREKLLLPYGYTILTLTAEDRFGRKTEERIELVYK